MRGLILAPYQNTQGSRGENDPNNTTIFVGGLDPSVTDDILKTVFGQYGELVHVKLPVGKRCGFVQFAKRTCAEQALSVLNGTQLGGQSIRQSWGRSSFKQTVLENLFVLFQSFGAESGTTRRHSYLARK
ncbi:polyadenylate-binding protein RBP45C-like isoform X2 [Citrus sinensis]|uniref:polyadenylate-binding protein RBP45C-like isoform X2 n=1 Tax=Citrus sinensis TaxID=2711 RepID=UPI002277E12D|nr:polyadenylate-binding protein RBP45C-like isoform X2 [Citrus sinensis]